MSNTKTFTECAARDGGCAITITHEEKVLGTIQAITYIHHDESSAVQGSLVFTDLKIHPNGATIKIDAMIDSNQSITIEMDDCTFSDRIELEKTIQFAASAHKETVSTWGLGGELSRC
jgi:hypothetical protein